MITLPVQAVQVLPHRNSMCCIDTLVACDENSATALVCLNDDFIFIEGKHLNPAAYIELAAQTAGAMMGFLAQAQGRSPLEGFLVGVQNFTIHHIASVNDILTIKVLINSVFEQITVLEFQIYKDNILCAEGNIKVYLPNTSQ
ncbi:Predicted 3-hydroxylacyl-ACP dehydratase, HotDog domain [Desulfovibrio litoralis DSM 11393]|uniref:Predicted 3-hydroxylacyl-ACP dehydratase, HotDog domain n=2 Tax=Desulfovibrio litoralis TaxID=466107 RepID=A0A1M7STN1_9BACT|nr:Predicted 3-hydroxylacyl-ACP dehydratase, HotDog domain [Desulfovibrio litoralis DSM 11393]